MASQADQKVDQEFLDSGQYTHVGVAKYEWVFGKTFLSSGGYQITKDILDKLPLKSGDRVLDVGCGLGGHSFFMAEAYGVQILAVDLSSNVLTVGREYLAEKPHLKHLITFELCDITTKEFDEGSLDLIHSRDALLHIDDKGTLIAKFHKWLKPGGHLVLTDYGRGTKSVDHLCEGFPQYVRERRYDLLTTAEYRKIMLSCGFHVSVCRDISGHWLRLLHGELNRLRERKDEFVTMFSVECWDDFMRNWHAKIHRCSNNEQIWISICANK